MHKVRKNLTAGELFFKFTYTITHIATVMWYIVAGHISYVITYWIQLFEKYLYKIPYLFTLLWGKIELYLQVMLKCS